MGLNAAIRPVDTKDVPISPQFTPYEFLSLSRYKFSTLTSRQQIMDFYFLVTFHDFRYGRKKKERTLVNFWFGKRIKLTTSAPTGA